MCGYVSLQIGKWVEDPADFYSSRVPKKQRKQSVVDELLADAEFRKSVQFLLLFYVLC